MSGNRIHGHIQGLNQYQSQLIKIVTDELWTDGEHSTKVHRDG